ncbi:hypothetical protein Hypma_001794 [Hypsizygus marmoreus]|uniref:Uncharacterized protein n=1 Tax=Hypsizygus marmoreus TaxID=39966 RepID=A0A369JBP8_HYPMA|nr:hypothetical protein Hypma_001794 [Hypsizygus marmoreus]
MEPCKLTTTSLAKCSDSAVDMITKPSVSRQHHRYRGTTSLKTATIFTASHRDIKFRRSSVMAMVRTRRKPEMATYVVTLVQKLMARNGDSQSSRKMFERYASVLLRV